VDELKPDEEKEPEGKRLVTILYSQSRDLYCVPSMNKDFWLSVAVHALPLPPYSPDTLYLGPVANANGMGYRKAYSASWRAIIPGTQTTVPEDDPLVLDYAAFFRTAHAITVR
jgi:hypothetical protein